MKQIITNNPQDTGHVLGVTTNRNKSFWEFLTKGQKSTVLISPDLGNKSDILKKAVFGHEYIHAYHRYLGLLNKYGAAKFISYSESSAYLKAGGEYYNNYIYGFNHYGAYFPSSFNWTHAIGKIVNKK